MAGTEINKYGGRGQLVELAEVLAAPVAGELATGHGAITFPARHPQYLGLFPGQKQFALPIDVLFNAGGQMFSEFDFEPEPIISREVRTAHVSLDALGRPAPYRVDIPILASLETSLDSLLERVKAMLTAERRVQNPARLAAELNRALDSQAIVVTEAVTSDFFHRTYIGYNNSESWRLHLASHQYQRSSLGWFNTAAALRLLPDAARRIRRPRDPI